MGCFELLSGPEAQIIDYINQDTYRILYQIPLDWLQSLVVGMQKAAQIYAMIDSASGELPRK